MAALRAELAVLEQQARDETDACWLRAVARCVGMTCFSAGDLVAHAHVDRELAAVLERRTSKQVGKRLAALEGRMLGGLCVARVKETECGWLWTITLPSTP